MRYARPVHSWKFWPTHPASIDCIQQQPEKEPYARAASDRDEITGKPTRLCCPAGELSVRA